VEVVTDTGVTHTSQRFTVAICTCRRSGTYPWCDTSHRHRPREPRTNDADPADPMGTPR